MFKQRRTGTVGRKKSRPFYCESLENRLHLAAQISVTTSAHVPYAVAFNAVAPGYSGAGPSRVETVTITNAGADPLALGSGAFSIVNDPSAAAAASDFTITNLNSIPASLASGASTTVDLQYSPTALYLQSALLNISTNDPNTPVDTINLHGIGTPGQYGVDEPSLVQVLRAHDIPTIVGAGPNDVNINTQKYPVNPDPTSQEVPMQRLVAANSALPVTITPIASFSANTQPVSQIGYYTPGDPNAQTELFSIAKSDSQVVDPTADGSTSFNPGTNEFGLYGTFVGTSTPNGSLDTHYSEDALNILDLASPRKIRFFPMKTSTGQVVPNQFVFAVEDYNDPTAYNSFINFVGIISNVQAAPNAVNGPTPSNPTGSDPGTMGVQEDQVAPGTETLVFNTIQNPNTIVADVVHNENSVTIYNTGDQPLTINSLVLSDTKNWALVSPPAPGTTIAGGSSLNVTIKFIATTSPPHSTNETNDIKSLSLVSETAAGGVWDGTLTINSSDTVNPTKVVNLAGYWQIESEHENEPSVTTLTNLMFGYSTSTPGSTSTNSTEYPNGTGAWYGNGTNEGSAGNNIIVYPGEVDPQTNQGLLVSANGGPVDLLEVAAFHQQYDVCTALDGTQGAAIYTATESGTTVTITTVGPETFKVGDTVAISGAALMMGTPTNPTAYAGYIGSFTITSVPSPTTFTYTDTTTMLGSYMVQPTVGKVGWYPSGGSIRYMNEDQPNNGQAVFPNLAPDEYSTVQTSFQPTGPFGIWLDSGYSQDSKNSVDTQYDTSLHALRFWPAEVNGNVIPNTWIIGLDYRDYANPNSDYQDMYMVLTNAAFESIPATPNDLQAITGTGNGGVTLEWSPMSSASGYNVYASVNGAAYAKLTSTPVTTTNFADLNEPAGASVVYEVTSVNSSGTESMAATSEKVQLPSGPSAPAITGADGSSGTMVALTWTAPVGATSYNVLREGPGQNTFQSLATGVTMTSYSDMTVLSGTTYEYEVQAVNSIGSSPVSAPQQVTVATPATAPAPPTGLTADGTPGTEIILTWQASASATSYAVLREAAGQTSYQTITPVGGVTATTFADTNVTPGGTYSYEVVATNSIGSSSPSTPVTGSASINVMAPAAPTNVQATPSGNSVSVTWSSSVGATSYTVEREGPTDTTFSDVAIGLTTDSYTDNTVLAGQTYLYEVVAVNSGGPSSPSAPPASASIPTGTTLDVTIGKGANAFADYTTASNTLVTLRLLGAGTATLHFTADSISQFASKKGTVVTGTNVALATIVTSGTNAGTRLIVTTSGGTNAASIGGITTGPLNSITATTSSLVGDLTITGSISKITLGSATAANISATGSIGTFQANSATGITLSAAGTIRSVIASTWSSNHAISAASVGSILIKGNAQLDITSGAVHSIVVKGTLNQSTIALSAAGALDLGSLTAGSIQSTGIAAEGNIGTIMANQLLDSQIYAGGPSTLLGSFPPVGASFPNDAYIANVTLRKSSAVNDQDSSIAAANIRRAALGNVQFANGGQKFGLEAFSVNSVTLADSTVGKLYTFTKLVSAAIVQEDLAAKGLSTQDFDIDII